MDVSQKKDASAATIRSLGDSVTCSPGLASFSGTIAAGHLRTSARVVHAFEVRHGQPLRPSQNRSYRQKRKQRKKRQEHKGGPKHISEKVGHLHSALLGNGVDHKVWRIADIG